MSEYPGLLGFRDVGGLRTEDGGRVRTGVLFRSGTPQFLDRSSARALLDDIGIRSTIDLRLPHEIEREGRGPLDDLAVRLVPNSFSLRARVSEDSAVAPMPARDPLVGTYLGYLAEDAAGVVALVSRLIEPETFPALVHCTVGKDRTGVAIALVLSAIGVRRADIVADYATNPDDVVASMERLGEMASYGAAAAIYPPEAWTAPPDVMARFLDEIDRRYGGVHALLRDHGVGAEEIQRLTDLLIEREERPMQVNVSRVIAATPDAVWTIGGDTANVAKWVPAIEKSYQEGDLRYATFAGGGGEATERIVEHSDEQRRYVYEYLSGPLPLEVYRSEFVVRDHGTGSEVVWAAEFRAVDTAAEPALAETISQIYGAALEQLALLVAV